jgi:glycosyltransferase involved in cell wall biosynthesis
MSDKLLSIIIPTKNRTEIAKEVILHILRVKSSKLEVIVHDNSDSFYLGDFATKICDERFIYKYVGTPLSTVDNFNQAYKYASGRFICYIGDDDGVIPEIIDVVEWMDTHDIDALRDTMSVFYTWPCNSTNGELHFFANSLTKCRLYLKPQIEKELRRLIHKTTMDYTNLHLPILYHGIVKKEICDLAIQKTGSLWGGCSPDIYAEINISNYVNTYVEINHPVIVVGTSSSSKQVHYGAEAEQKKLCDAPHIKNIENYKWESIVPMVYSSTTVLLDSAIKAYRDIGKSEWIKLVNPFWVAASVLKFSPHHKSYIYNDYLINLGIYKSQHINKLVMYMYMFQYRYSFLISKICEKMVRILTRTDNRLVFNNVCNISKAIEIFEMHQKYNLDKILLNKIK